MLSRVVFQKCWLRSHVSPKYLTWFSNSLDLSLETGLVSGKCQWRGYYWDTCGSITVKSVQTSHQATGAHSKKTILKAWNYITIDFHQEMGQEFSTIVQIIVKADRGKAIAWRSVSCKMTCYYIPDVKTLQILSLHFVSTLKSAVYILYPVCGLLSAFCTNRYPWHQYSLFLVTFIRTTHNLPKKYLCVRYFDIFVLFRVNTLLSFCKNVDHLQCFK